MEYVKKFYNIDIKVFYIYYSYVGDVCSKNILD